MQAGTLLLHVALCLALALLAQAHLRLSRQTNTSPISGANVTHSTEYDEPSNVLRFRFNVDLGYAAARRPPTIRRSELQRTESGFNLVLEVPVQPIEALSSYNGIPQSDYKCLNGWYMGSSNLSKRSVVQCKSGVGLSHSGISRNSNPENSWNNVNTDSRRNPLHQSSVGTPKDHVPDKTGGWILRTTRPQLQKQSLRSNRRNIETASTLVNSWNIISKHKSSSSQLRGLNPLRNGGNNARSIRTSINGPQQTQATRPPNVQRPGSSENKWWGYRR